MSEESTDRPAKSGASAAGGQPGDPLWRDEFPLTSEGEDFVARRDFTRYLIAASGVFAAGAVGAGTWATMQRANSGKAMPIVEVGDIPEDGEYLFKYPGDDDPAILVRLPNGALRAFTQKCTHLGCVVYFEADDEEGRGSVEVAMQWNSSFNESVHTFANTINTHEGGTHEEGFRAAMTKLVNEFARRQGLLKDKDENLTGDDIREGLTAVVSVKLGEPQFEGQTKTKLGNSEVKGFVQRAMTDLLMRSPKTGMRNNSLSMAICIFSERFQASMKK